MEEAESCSRDACEVQNPLSQTSMEVQKKIQMKVLNQSSLEEADIAEEPKKAESPSVVPNSGDLSDLKEDSSFNSNMVSNSSNEEIGATNEKSNENGEQRTSPEPNCAICLGNLENKSFTDSCFHEFCFTCLLEWSKVKAECPLCKQAFKSIIHNVRSIEDYDQYYITVKNSSRYPFRSGSDRRFRYSTTLTSERLRHLAFERSLDFQNYRLAFAPHMYHGVNYNLSSQSSTGSDYRRRIYDNNLWVCEQREYPRFREANPEFFKQNPACTHRLISWLNRELLALLPGGENQVSFVLELILALIMRFEITSSEFHEHIYPYLQNRTPHFVHEFNHFARSPFEMDVYDRHVNYRPGDALGLPIQPLHLDGSNIPLIDLDDESELDVEVASAIYRHKHHYATRLNQSRSYRWLAGQSKLSRPSRNFSSNHSGQPDFVNLDMPSTSNAQSQFNTSIDPIGATQSDDDCVIVDLVDNKATDQPPTVIDIISSSDESEVKMDKKEDELERPSRKNRCTFHYDYSSDSGSETNESSTNNSIESARNIKKIKIKSFIGNIVRNISLPSTSDQSSSSNQTSHKKHKKSKKHKHKHHRHRHHSKHE